MQEQWSIHPDDPLTASVTANWEQTGGRTGNLWSTEVQSKMHCNATHFFFTASLIARLNDEVFFTRDYEDTIERNLV